MIKIIFLIIFLDIILATSLFAGQIPPGQSVGSTLRQLTDEKKEKETERRLTSPKTVPPSLDQEEVRQLPGNVEKIYIQNIIVQEDRSKPDRVNKYDLLDLVRNYERRYLSLGEMRTLADSITQQFSYKGVRAYVPQQSFAGGMMYINIVDNE